MHLVFSICCSCLLVVCSLFQEKHALRTSKVIPNVLQGNMVRDDVSAVHDSEKSVGSYTAHETGLLDSEKENRYFADNFMLHFAFMNKVRNFSIFVTSYK